MAIIKCPECGHQVSDQAKFCPSCGIEIAGKVMRCPHCNEIVFKNQKMCPYCHQMLSQPAGVENHETDVQTCQGVAPGEKNETLSSSVQTQVKEPARGSKKRRNSTLVIAFTVSLVAVLVGFYFFKSTAEKREMDAYLNARSSSEPAVLQSYLDQFTDAPVAHRDTIQNMLEMLGKLDVEWNDAVTNGTRMALERYVRLFPNSIHVQEAKLKIDSLDWVQAVAAGTSDAVQDYLTRYPDGLYVDEANDMLQKLKAKDVSDTEKVMVKQLFTRFFDALSSKDGDLLTADVNNVMTSFLHRANATKADVLAFMHKIYSPEDISSMTFRQNNDWKIDKKETDDGAYNYAVTFSVDQKIDRSDKSKESFCTYRIKSVVSSDGKILEMNMQKLNQ